MRSFAILLAAAILTALPLPQALAQSAGVADHVELIDPALTTRVLYEKTLKPFTGFDACSYPLGGLFPLECRWRGAIDVTEGALIALDAAGRVYSLVPTVGYNLGAGRFGTWLQRGDGSGVGVDVARVIRRICPVECTQPSGYSELSSTALADVANGKILLFVTVVNYRFDGIERKAGILEISGLPTLFETWLTFTPTGALAVVTPRHPDGFESAEAFEVWAGNLSDVPDWSTAVPISCEAAVNPAPGQSWSIQDPLPAPAPGEGRYLLVVSRNGAERRVGRQNLDGRPTARDSATLPTCAVPLTGARASAGFAGVQPRPSIP